MAILIDETKRVLVQGITGREGRARTRLMREYGTNVVAGVTPGKGGENVLGVPVFNTPQDAVNSLGKIDISVLFVPAAGVKEAAISAIEAGIDRKSTRLNSSHGYISYAVFCLKKKKYRVSLVGLHWAPRVRALEAEAVDGSLACVLAVCRPGGGRTGDDPGGLCVRPTVTVRVE